MYVENWIEYTESSEQNISYDTTERGYEDGDPEEFVIEGNRPLDFS